MGEEDGQLQYGNRLPLSLWDEAAVEARGLEAVFNERCQELYVERHTARLWIGWTTLRLHSKRGRKA